MAWRDRLRSYTILIDEGEVGSVRDGESAGADLEAGHHRLRLKIDWTGSRTIAFEAGEGEVKEFECRPRYPAAMALIALIESAVRHDRWIRLTVRD
jgi:hypothetical protein